MKLVFFMTGMMVLWITGCKKPESPAVKEQTERPAVKEQIVPPVSEPKLSLPVNRTIVGKDGRELAVTVVKRSASHIRIVRDSDQKTFDLAIMKLSERDRDFMNKLPLSVIAPTSAADRRLQNRQKEISKLEEKVRGYQNDLASGGLTSSQSSMVHGKIKRLKQEIFDLRGDIR